MERSGIGLRTYFSRQYLVEWLLVAGLLWSTFDQFALGKYSWMRTIDNGNQSIPGLLSNGLLGFDAPLWHFFGTAGNDRLALGYFGWLHTVFFQALPGWLALQIFTVSQCVLAAVAVYALCRRLGLDKVPSTYAALLMGATNAGAQLVLSVDAYLPLSILAVSLVLERRTDWKRWLLLAAVGLLISYTSYMSRLVPFVFLVHFLWFALVERRTAVRDWLIILSFAVVIVAFRGQDFVALALYGKLSDRHFTGPSYDFNVMPVLSHLSVYFFGSLLKSPAAILSGIGLFLFRRRLGAHGWVMAALFAGIAMIIIVPLIKPILVDILPVIRTYKFNRFFKFLLLFLALGGAFGIQALLDRDRSVRGGAGKSPWHRPEVWLVGAAFALLFGFSLQLKYGNLREWVSQGNYVLNYESPVLRDLAADIDRRGAPVRAASLQMYANYPNAYGIESIGGYQALQIRRFHQFWQTMIAPTLTGTTPHDEGDRLYLMVSPVEHRPEWALAELYDPELLALANVRYLISRDRLIGPSLVTLHQPAGNLGGPWSNLTTRQKIESNIRGNFTGRTHLYIYENTDAFPRFFMVERVRPLPGDEDVLAAIAAADLKTLRTTAFVAQSVLPPGLSTTTLLAQGDINLEHYSGDEIRLAVRLDGAGVLVVTNTYSPYWEAYVDGVKTPIFPADHTFWGLALPKDAKSVVFRYEPPYRIF